MKTVRKNIVTLSMLVLFLSFFLSCSKDSDLLLDEVLKDSSVSIEERNGTIEEPSDEAGFVIRTFSFSPRNDAYLQNNQGYDQSLIRLEEDNRTSYLMFDLSEINGPIQEATLEFLIDSDEGDGNINILKGASANWTEETLNFNSAPVPSTPLGNINKSYKVGELEKVALTTENLSAEMTTLVMTHTDGNDLAFASKEHPVKSGPKLVITYKAAEGSPYITQTAEEKPLQDENDDQNDNTPLDNSASTSPVQGAYYVTTNGNSNNDGLSETNAWSIEHAFEHARAGDVVYIKAGNYGAKQLTVDNSGTSENPIKFIGYTNTPGDLTSNNGSTFVYGNQLDANIMPLLRYENGEYGVKVLEDYVELSNIQITRYRVGVKVNGRNIKLKNIVAIDLGNQSSYNAYDGFGFEVRGTDNLIEDCFVQNATAEAIKLTQSSNSRINYCKVYADNPSNPTDYYFFITGNTTNSIIENSYAERAQGLRHGGHGFDLKDRAENNIIRNCTVRRTSLEVNFSGVKNNVFENCNIYGVDTNNANWHASILIANGANSNTFKDINIENTWAAIRFSDYDDGYVGPDGDRDLVSMGDNNVFENVSIKNTNRIINSGTGNYIGAKARNNTFLNCDFEDFDSVGIIYFPFENAIFENCSFKNGNKLINQVESYSNFSAVWRTCSWSNVNFTPPN